MSESTATIFTDGAASPNPGQGGYGVVMLWNGRRQELSGGFRSTTNNRMELLSVIMALRQFAETPVATRIYSDSKYVVDNLTSGYAAKWRSNHWRTTATRQPAKNADLWAELLTLTERHPIRFVWVKGHAENPENNRCDELAVLARQTQDLPPDEGYENLPGKPPEPPQQLQLFNCSGG